MLRRTKIIKLRTNVVWFFKNFYPQESVKDFFLFKVYKAGSTAGLHPRRLSSGSVCVHAMQSFLQKCPKRVSSKYNHFLRFLSLEDGNILKINFTKQYFRKPKV